MNEAPRADRFAVSRCRHLDAKPRTQWLARSRAACLLVALVAGTRLTSSSESPVAPYTVVSWTRPAAADTSPRCHAALLNPVWAIAMAACSPADDQPARARVIGAADVEGDATQETRAEAIVRAPAANAKEQVDFVLVRLAPPVRLPTLSGITASKPIADSSRVGVEAINAEPLVRWNANLDGNVLDAFVVGCEVEPCADAARLPVSRPIREWLLDTLARSGETLEASAAGKLTVGGWFEMSASEGAYRVKPGNRALRLQGQVNSPSILEFDVTVPGWNFAARCGRKQPKFACLWAARDGRAHDRVCNGPRQRARIQRISVPLATGPFEVSVASDESDGCGWPQGTAPYVLSNPRIASR